MPTLAEPRADLDSDLFYEAAGEGRFLIRRCTLCLEAHWYPRPACPFCSGVTRWEAASGSGTLYSYSAIGDEDAGQILAYVTLAEGPTMLTNIVAANRAELRIGQTMELTWQAAGTRRVPCFKPAGVDLC